MDDGTHPWLCFRSALGSVFRLFPASPSSNRELGCRASPYSTWGQGGKVNLSGGVKEREPRECQTFSPR